jgi:hypothetical protein
MVALRDDEHTASPAPRKAARPPLRVITSRGVPLRRVAPSMLPDGAEYEDTGCEFAPKCLACPFSACKYDDPQAFKLDAARRDREIARLRRDYRVPIAALMKTYGLSRTHVYRALREHGAIRPWVDRNGQSKKRKTPARSDATEP